MQPQKHAIKKAININLIIYFSVVKCFGLPPTKGLCAGVALEYRPPVTAAPLLLKINIKNQCLAMLVKSELRPGYAELSIVKISSRTCTKPNVQAKTVVHKLH